MRVDEGKTIYQRRDEKENRCAIRFIYIWRFAGNAALQPTNLSVGCAVGHGLRFVDRVLRWPNCVHRFRRPVNVIVSKVMTEIVCIHSKLLLLFVLYFFCRHYWQC